MNTKIYHSLYALFVAGALLASGCSNDDDAYDFYAAHPDAVRFHITAGDMPQTRVNTEANGSSFDVKDQIAISADGGTSYSTYVQSSGDDWLPAEGQRYLRWKEEELSFQAYYPVTEGTDYTKFTVPMDQRGQTNLRNADYMTAEATGQTPTPVALTFKHRLAKVTVSITMSEELTGETINLIVFYTKGRTLENGSITDGNSYEPYYPHLVGNGYMAILPPQSGDNSALFIQMRLDSGSEYTLTGIPALKSGKAYTLALQVGHEGIKQVSPITVADWGEPDKMTGGTATDLTIWDGKYPTSDAEAQAWMGEETSGANDPTAANHVFTIKAARQLAALHYLMVNDIKLNGAQGSPAPSGTEGDGYNYATYNLAADIDLNNKSWEPIGVKQNKDNPISFSGIFNGQGHTVSGMNIQKDIPSGVKFYAGFFSYIGYGTVTSLNVQGNINVESSQYCGGIVGYQERGTIAFCSFQGSIIASNTFPVNPCTAGGITGLTFNTDAKIISCYSVFSQFDVTALTIRKGSIAGELGQNCTIQGCYWQKLTGLDDTNPYGFSETPVIVENNGTFTDAAGANHNTVITAMNQYDAGYDYHWQAATDGGYPVLVKKQ